MRIISMPWKALCLGYQTKGVRLLQSCFYGKLVFWKGGNLPKPTSKQQRQEAPFSTYINNISQLLVKKKINYWLVGRDNPFIKWALQAPDISKFQSKWICGEFNHLDGVWLCPPHVLFPKASCSKVHPMTQFASTYSRANSLSSCSTDPSQYFSIKLLNLPGKNADIFLFICSETRTISYNCVKKKERFLSYRPFVV